MAKTVEQDRKGSCGGQEGPGVHVPLFSRTIKILTTHTPRLRDFTSLLTYQTSVASVLCEC